MGGGDTEVFEGASNSIQGVVLTLAFSMKGLRMNESKVGKAAKNQGEANYNAKLNKQKVAEIRELASREKVRNIALLYGIHPSTAYRIIKRELWKH